MFQIPPRQAGATSRLLHLSRFNSYRPVNISQGYVSKAARSFQTSHVLAQQSSSNKSADSVITIENAATTASQKSVAESKDMVKLKMKLFSSNIQLLDYYEKYLTFYCQAMNPKVYKLPTRRKTFVLLKSPHVNKKAKEHFFFEGNYRVVEVGVSKTGAQYVMSLLKNVHNLDVKFNYTEM